MSHRRWWQPPQLILADSEHDERKVTWLELFSDLVFVVVISQLAHYLSQTEHISAEGILYYVLLFIPVWWVWIGYTFYDSRFATEDISYRIIVFVQMLPVMAMAIHVHEGMESHSRHFAVGYILARVILILLWLRGGYYSPQFRPVSNGYALGFGISVLCWIASIVIRDNASLSLALKGLGLLIDLLTPVFTIKAQVNLPRLSNAKLPERFGLFVLIVLGETIVGVVNGAAEATTITAMLAITAILGMAFSFGIWWVYFDFIGRRLPRRGVAWQFAWGYLHLPLVMGIAAMGAGVLNLIGHDEEEAITDAMRWLLCGAAAEVLIIMGLLEMTLRPGENEPTQLRTSAGLKIGAGVVALLLGLVSTKLSATAILGLLASLVLIQMIYGAYCWFHADQTALEKPRPDLVQ